ncbi:hypothetical protein QBC35DRAFT_418996 [Podospora australis]|uniref:Uncharacterized protein n=1 Tax=Podospora australis TaxID=1536484 RepID=A0AAN7AEA3_9PEZI|nr:hypothetical protein QBC35DRAFT_418996 [Podospora australis]
MDQSQIPPASSPGTSQQQKLVTMESPIYHTYPQGTLAFASWGNQQNHYALEAQTAQPGPEFSGHFDNNMQWPAESSSATMAAAYDPSMYDQHNNDAASSHDVVWPAMQEQVPMGGGDNGYSNPSSIAESPASLSGFSGQAWAPSPSGYPASTAAWMANDQQQPLPSPLSEVPSYSSEVPSYGSEIPGYGGYNVTQNPASGRSPVVPTTSFLSDSQQDYTAAASPPTSSAATTISRQKQLVPKTTKRGRPKGSSNKPKTTATGEKVAKGTKRKSPAPSGDSPSSSTSATALNLGIFPPNVDPKAASEKLQREAWERCKSEAASMSRRRELLLSSRTELQKETQKLQANIGHLREAVAREHEQLKEAVRMAARLNEGGYY